MAEQDKDLATILEDVKTIKSILQNTDAPLPPVWRLIYFIAFPAIVLIALLKFFVPPLAAMTFLDTVLWLWVPTFTAAGIIIAWRVASYLKKTGTRFLAQSRVQVFLYTRFILAPAVVTIGYLLSLGSGFSLEGAMAVLVAVGLTQVVVLMPREFKAVPFVFLVGGWAELAFDFRGAAWTLVNTLLVAFAFAWIASLLEKGETHQEPHRG